MTDYRIKATGSSFVIAADGQDVLRCADGNIARRIVRDAQADRFSANSCRRNGVDWQDAATNARQPNPYALPRYRSASTSSVNAGDGCRRPG